MLIDKIASDLGLSKDYIALLARTATYRYKSYSIPKKNGGTRTISQPARELKLLQYWLIKNVLVRLPVHKSAAAYRKGSNTYKNASIHRAHNFLLKVDFADFFHSIRGGDIARLFQTNRNLLRGQIANMSDIGIVRSLVCRDDRLTIGAPSSPLLSNSVMFDFDEKWSTYCRKRKIRYSRYADDLYFSTNEPNVLSGLLVDLRNDLRQRQSPLLQINDAKTTFTSRKRRRLVTGLVLTPTGAVSLGRQRKRFIKSLVYRNSRQELQPEEISSLKGMLSYARSVEPTFVDSLRTKYGPEAIGGA